jgi:hypothetical protein
MNVIDDCFGCNPNLVYNSLAGHVINLQILEGLVFFAHDFWFSHNRLDSTANGEP